jgi:myo-inositol catabolism protein IolS
MNRRSVLLGAAGLAGAAATLAASIRHRQVGQNFAGLLAPAATPQQMHRRAFGKTGLQVSEVGFGGWGIGGDGYGAVEAQEALRTLARAEELGCNFVDTAMVYGDSEVRLGEFLAGRRSRWIVATKFSGQSAGMTATLETQLRRLRTDAVDVYQLHWVPRGKDEHLLEEVHRLKQAGKVRFVGVSVYSSEDIDYVSTLAEIDALQVGFNLLEPDPFMARAEKLQAWGKAVIVRSALMEGFLTGKFARDARFPAPNDQRHGWSAAKIAQTVDRAERFRFLEQEAGSMVVAAARYALSFSPVSTVILGTKSISQASSNFGQVPGGRLSAANLRRIRATQIHLGLGSRWPRTLRRVGLAL